MQHGVSGKSAIGANYMSIDGKSGQKRGNT